MKSLSHKLLTFILLCMLLAGCTIGVTDQTGKILEDAIAALDRQPNAWQSTLTDTIGKLKAAGSMLTSDVENMLSESTALVTTQVQCNVDIVGVRIKDALRYLRDSKVKQLSNAQFPTPWVCVFVPNHLKLTKSSSSSSWMLLPPHIVDVYGVNFRFLNLPAVDQLNSQGNVVRGNILKSRLQSAYLLQLDCQVVDFSQVNPGDYFALHWKESPDRYTISGDFIEPPKPITGSEDFRVNVHANSGLFSGDCVNIQNDSAASHRIGSGWQKDRTKGDPTHPGVSEIAMEDNRQSMNSLRGYNYQAIDDWTVHIEGTICGAGGAGPGAIFNRVYRVYLIKA